MLKKIAIGVVIVLALVFLVKKTQIASYASTLIAKGKEHFRGQIPRDLELARVQHEIDQLDNEYADLLGPIAEKMAGISKLEREIASARAHQKDLRTNLLALTEAVEAKKTFVSYNDSKLNLDQAKVRLAKEFSTFKQLEVNLATKEKLLDAEAKNLAATRDQLERLVSQKREFEIRLANLQAEEAALKAASVATPLVTDDGRVADIKNTLDRIEHSQTVEQQKRVLQQQYGSKISDAPVNGQAQSVDMDEIRDFLQGKNGSTKVVQNNK